MYFGVVCENGCGVCGVLSGIVDPDPAENAISQMFKLRQIRVDEYLIRARSTLPLHLFILLPKLGCK